MTKERISDIAKIITVKTFSAIFPDRSTIESAAKSVLESLPEFQEPQWTKCSVKMPEMLHVLGWHGKDGWHQERFTRPQSTERLPNSVLNTAYWYPESALPEPPKEEESALQKELDLMLNEIRVETCYPNTEVLRGKIREIVKRHECEKANPQ